METKKLGFGLMRLPLLDKDDAGSVDVEHLKEMVDVFLERGFTYFDTAWMYCKFQSEIAIREALVKRHPRDAYTLTTKLHVNYVKEQEDKDRIFNEQKEKTGVEYFDYYLLHALSRGNYPKYEEMHCFEWLSEKKEKGEVKHIGFSYHDDAQFLDELLTAHPEVEFVQLQLNYLDWDSEDVQSRLCYETAVKHGKKVIVMEPVKGGRLADVNALVKERFTGYDETASMASWAVRFCASLEHVFMVLSGMSNLDQLLDNTSYMMHFTPLNDSEQALVKEAADIISSADYIQCTGCAYCVDGCPQNIVIPRYMSLYNADINETDKHEINRFYYEGLCSESGKASDCIGCGHCESVCPQKLPIIDSLAKIVKHFES